MPSLVDNDRSWSKVADMLDDPKRRHLVDPEDREAAQKLSKSMAGINEATQMRMKDMREAIQRAIAPIVTGPGPTIIDQIREVTNIVSPKVTLMSQIFTNQISPLLQRSAEAHKHFAELREAFAPPTTDIRPLIALRPREPVEIIQPYPSTVRIENPEEIALVLAKEINNQIPPAPTIKNPLALVECVYLGDELHLRILKFPVMIFEGLRASIINFFYTDPYRGQWRSYGDMRHLGASAASIRQAIEDINKRVHKETKKKTKEFIASRQTGSRHTSPKEYRYAL